MLSAPLLSVRAVRLRLFGEFFPSLSSKRHFFGLFLPHRSGVNCTHAPLQSVCVLFHFLNLKKNGVLSLQFFTILLDRYLDSWYLERSLQLRRRRIVQLNSAPVRVSSVRQRS